MLTNCEVHICLFLKTKRRMEKTIFVLLLWSYSVYNYVECNASQDGNLREENEPHPYTISFFTFPNGAANDLLKPKRESERENHDLSLHETIKATETKVKESKETLSADNKKELKLENARTSFKKHAAVHEVEKEKILAKSGKITKNELNQNNLNKLHSAKHHVANMDEEESYQEGSMNHPSHTMYPMCHHCPSNSSYEECVTKSTLRKCDSGLNNICFTKSLQSNSQVIYEMGCSNHKTCRNAKAKPCKGKTKKCFVCCQFDGCNAVRHNYMQSQLSADDDNLGYSAFNTATRTLPSATISVVALAMVAWIRQW